MSESLFKNLKKVGVDESTAYEVSNAMDPQRYATRQDLVEAIAAMRDSTVAIRESIAAHREETQKNISAIREETQKNISAHREETQKNISAMREETQKNISAHREETQKNIVANNRQLWIFFSTIIVTLIVLVIGTWYRFPQPPYPVGANAELKLPTSAVSKSDG